jgi:hypothetical protein
MPGSTNIALVALFHLSKNVYMNDSQRIHIVGIGWTGYPFCPFVKDIGIEQYPGFECQNCSLGCMSIVVATLNNWQQTGSLIQIPNNEIYASLVGTPGSREFIFHFQCFLEGDFGTL